jgi:hypothetical protein
MKRALMFVAGVLLLVVAAVAPAEAQNLTKSDREQLIKYLKETREGVEKATKGLSPEQMNFKAAPERWSVAECLEHIAASEDFLLALVTDNVMKAPAPAGPFDAAKAHEVDAKIKQMITDRSQKAQAPEPLRPTNRFSSPQGSWQHFADSRKRTIEYAKKENGLRDHAMDSPAMKGMDGYQWLLFLSAHSARHTAQIREVKADANFPKKKSRY